MGIMADPETDGVAMIMQLSGTIFRPYICGLIHACMTLHAFCSVLCEILMILIENEIACLDDLPLTCLFDSLMTC